MQSAISNHRSAFLLLLSLAAMPLPAGVSNITQHTMHATIAAAISAANAGDVLNVSTGDYAGGVVVDKNLAIRGGYDDACATPITPYFSTIIPASGIGVSFGPSTGEMCGFEVRSATMSGMYFANSASWMLSNCLVLNNVSPDFGGGLDIRNSSHVVLENTQVFNNQAAEQGGGANVDSTSSLTIGRDSSVYYNHAPMGGGATVRNGSSILLRDQGAMYGNVALTGGAVHAAGGARVVVDDGGMIGDAVVFNVASNMGGGVCAIEATVIVTNTGRIAGNRSLDAGGGVAVASGMVVVAGGSIGALDGTTVISNSAVTGGGVYACDNSTVMVTRSGVVMAGRADNGAGIYAYESYVQLSDGAVIGHADINAANIAGAYGGGISLRWVSLLECRDSSVINNRTDGTGGGCHAMIGSSIVASNTLFAGNGADYGGGIELFGHPLGSGYCVLDSVVISNNTASSDEGGIGFSGTSSNLVIRNSTIIANTAAGDYGGVWAGAWGDAIIEHSTLRDNSAGRQGGAVGCTYGTLRITDCIIANNRASGGHGGGVYGGGLSDMHATISNSTFTGNAAWGFGGAAYLQDSIVDRCVVSSNQAYGFAGGGGGGGLWLQSNVVALQCLVVSNYASNAGGGVYICDQSVLDNCTICDNKAGLFDGGVHIDGLAFAQNCILYFNEPDNYTTNATDVTYQNCCATPPIAGALDAGGNISANPLLDADYSLTEPSPCRDTGTNMPWMTGAKDLAGDVRIYNGIVDMGAYEFVPEPAATALFVICYSLLIIRRRSVRSVRSDRSDRSDRSL